MLNVINLGNKAAVDIETSLDIQYGHQALMMEAAHTSETSVDMHLRTRQYIPKILSVIPHIGQPKFHLDCRFLFNLLFFHARLIHRSDDGGSKHL
jgi:hypothetical protein